MADLGGYFDATNVPTLDEYTPVPAGSYRAAIVRSEFKETKNGQGKYLELVFEILEGPSANRLLTSRLNLMNSNATAVEIARKELSSICHAAGKLKVRDSAELHGIPLVISVAIKKRADNGEPTNEISGYKSVKEFAEQRQVQAQTQSKASPGASSSSAPAWMQAAVPAEDVPF